MKNPILFLNRFRLPKSLTVSAVFYHKDKKIAVNNMLLDTGASISIISEDMAKQLGLELRVTPFYVAGIGGKVATKLGIVDKIEIPSSRCKAVNVYVLVYKKKDALPAPYKGILGLDFMKLAKMELAAFTKSQMIKCLGQALDGTTRRRLNNLGSALLNICPELAYERY